MKKKTNKKIVATMVEAEKTFEVGKWYPSSECPDRTDYNVLAWFENEDGDTSIRIMHREGDRKWALADDGVHGRGVQNNAVICWTPLPDMPYATRLKIQDETYRKNLEAILRMANCKPDWTKAEEDAFADIQKKLDEQETLSIYSKADFEDYTKKGYTIQ